MSKIFLSTKATTSISFFTLIFFILTGVIAIALGITDPPRFLSSFTYYISYIIGGIIGIYASKRVGLHTHIGKSLLFLGLALITTFIGALVWDYYDFVLGVGVPYPSWADLFFSLFVPFTFIGLWLILKIYNVILSKRIILEALVIFVLVPVIIYSLFGPQEIFDNQSILATYFNIFYSLSDAIMIAMAYVILRTASKKMFDGIFYIAGGLVITVLGDMFFSYRTATETYYFGDISDFLFIIAGLTMTTGIYLIGKNFVEKEGEIR